VKSRAQPTERELFIPDDACIVTKTDPKGHITYCNQLFVEISGYPENELLGAQHNIVRHPHMPRGVFQLLWDTLKANQEFNGYIKNMTRDGDFYWAFANVTPSRAPDNSLLGYYSVRRRPRQAGVAVIAALYQDMLAAERQAGVKDAIATSTALLNDLLHDKGVDYDEFVLTL
jgi:PAS domain S-box-containing protein